MLTRGTNETLNQFAIRTAWTYGHFWSPENPDGGNVTQADLAKLTVSDPVVVKALISLSKMDCNRFQSGEYDGRVSPAMIDLIHADRCPVPDYAPPQGCVFAFDDPDLQQIAEKMQADAAQPATGSGNWPSCHGIGNFHCAIVAVNSSGLPSFLKPLWKQVLTNVQRAYAGVGLLFRFLEGGTDLLTGQPFSGNINTDLSFVSSSQGWIGLAIVGTNEGCGSRIWCKFLSTYRGGQSAADVVTQWTTLVKHELGHNCGRSHTSGGVMNPSIVNGLPTLWTPSDPSTNWLNDQFGGVPVPIPGAPNPPVPDPPPATLEARLHALEVGQAVQAAKQSWCIEEIRKLKDRG